MKDMSGKTKTLKIVDTELPKWYDGAKYTEGDIVTNPFSGEQAVLTPNELAMYDLIMGAQLVQDWKLTQKGLDWFRGANARAYMILLD